jgi:hypothetical protein
MLCPDLDDSVNFEVVRSKRLSIGAAEDRLSRRMSQPRADPNPVRLANGIR